MNQLREPEKNIALNTGFGVWAIVQENDQLALQNSEYYSEGCDGCEGCGGDTGGCGWGDGGCSGD